MVRKVLLMACGCMMLAATMAKAQTSDKGNFKYSAPKVTLRQNGARLDGTSKQPAHISSPNLDITALAIAFDYTNSQIQQVRAIGQVNLRLEMAGKNGAPATHIKASSDKATLNPLKRQLILEGNVDGYFQTGDGPRTTLTGSKAILSQVNNQIKATLEGPVRLVIPPESTSNAGALGTIVITSQYATLDQAKGQVVFSGNAHAVSTDGPNQFDVTAPQFILTRSANGTIDTLRTKGRTLLKIDLPPQPPSVDADDKESALGHPTHVEVTADAAIVSRPTSTLTFIGNVEGFYELAPAGKPSQRYNFSGQKAVLRQLPVSGNDGGLVAEITGQPVTIFAPGLSFNMNDDES